MNIPDTPIQRPSVSPEDAEAVSEALKGGWLTMGPRTIEFETAFKAYVGCRHAVAVSSCTAALHLARLT